MKKKKNLIDLLRPLQSLTVQEIYEKEASFWINFKNKLVLAGFSDDSFKNLSLEERISLRFADFSKGSIPYSFIPLYIFKLLEDDTLVVCPFDKETITKSFASLDARLGCVAYEFVY